MKVYKTEENLELKNFRLKLRKILANYISTEGCDCCRIGSHDEYGAELAKLLKVRKYKDESGYDWSKYLEK